MLDQALSIFRAGGWVMYPLLGLSLLAMTLSIERLLFFATQDGRSARRAADAIGRHLAARRAQQAQAVAEQSSSVYGRFAAAALSSTAGPGSTLAAFELVRGSLERFSATLSAIITAAPMLGILGTVVGIIDSFRLLGDAGPVTDPAAVAAGISTALYTTAFGLIVALVTLFPYTAIRARADRCAARLEALAEAIDGTQRAPANRAASSDSA